MTSNPIVVIPSGEIISSSNDEQQLTRQESTSSLCPSGVGLEDDEASQNSSDNALRVAIQACPVLSENGCLFSKPNTAEELRQTLIQIPPSHFNKNNSLFRNALQFFRRSSVIEGESINKVIEEFSGEFVNTEFDSRTQETTISSTDSLSSSEIPTLSDDSSSSEDELLLSTIRLSDALKKGTSEAHEAAENVHFVKNFIKGDIDRDMYADLILSLYYVYETLEKELDNKAPDHFCACHFPEDLARKETLVEDVEFWHGDDYFAKPHSMSPATRDYVERLKWISRTEPLLLLSHAYTRYLGDLSGGKFLARVARRAMKLQGGDGLAFYTFENIPSEKAFKDMYREALDDLPLSTQQIEALVREANVAFLLNMRLFEELDVKSNCLSSVRPLTEVLRFKPQKTLKELMFPKEGTDASEECPFLRRKKEQSSNTVLQQQNSSSGARCPWPFVFFHDPITGLRDYQTWVLVGILLSWFWCSYIQ
eukprot:CAMPEP_0194132186 /NCGR_PEP_ID=MMETSP0152-20130528/2720_1 /TAXON_ID=1049557 /ORGANISM="Thalassiothrix antarctica, Strain L6-D1" /LENGTH=480 /DNA_ID=CAMNT_0038827151 /DNA_START=14 /DNA_END=1456 /DNA_ORIENTATION=+